MNPSPALSKTTRSMPPRSAGLNRLNIGVKNSTSSLYFGPDSLPGSMDAPPAPPGGNPVISFEKGKIGMTHEYYPKYPIEYEIGLNTPENEIYFSWSVEFVGNFGYILVERIGAQEVSEIRLEDIGSARLARAPGSKFFLQVHPLNSGSAGIPAGYAMGDFFPNPFNPSTRVRFRLPFESVVSYDISNLLGETVASSADLSLPAGEHTINWDGRGDDGGTVGSGVYFLAFTARASGHGGDEVEGRYRAVRKLLFIR